MPRSPAGHAKQNAATCASRPRPGRLHRWRCPPVSHAYPGDRPDVTQFALLTEELRAPLRGVPPTKASPGSPWSLTPVRTPTTTTNSLTPPLHFVGSLPPSDHPDFLAFPKGPLPGRRHRTIRRAQRLRDHQGRLREQRRLVVTHSARLHNKQSRGLRPDPGQGPPSTPDLRPASPGKRPQVPPEGRGRDRRHPRPPGGWAGLSPPLSPAPRPELRLRWRTKQGAARAALEEELFGKRILFTDKRPRKPRHRRRRVPLPVRRRRGLPTDEGPQVPRSPRCSTGPNKIRVHVAYCVLALMVARLMVREADRATPTPQRPRVLDTRPESKRPCSSTRAKRGRPRARRMLTDIDPRSRASTTFSVSAPTPQSAELGNTPRQQEHRC